MQNENELQYSIKELRIRKNETQKDTADAVGISVQTYCAWEKDISNVGVSKVNALAHHFGVKLSQIKIQLIFFTVELEYNSSE